MNTKYKVFSFGVAGLLVTFGAVTQARANLDACGGMYLEVDAAASCVVVPTTECTPKCELVAGEKVCAARLTEMCAGSCSASAAVTCLTTCTGTCVPSCTAQPSQPPNCMGLCMSDCQQDCTTKCADAPNQGECRSSCAQCCSVDCDAQCASAPEPTCDIVCGVACAGSCEGKANIDCQVDCQSTLYTDCETEVVEECKEECTTTGGAIFCDGQFLATAGDLEACAAELEAELDVTLDVSIATTGSCDGNSCEGTIDAKGTVGCSMAPAQNAAGGGLACGFVALLGVGLARRRRTSKPSSKAL